MTPQGRLRTGHSDMKPHVFIGDGSNLIVGARLTAELSPIWSVILRGDVGGFGLLGNQGAEVGCLAYGGARVGGQQGR